MSEVPEDVCICEPWSACDCGGTRDLYLEMPKEEIRKRLPNSQTGGIDSFAEMEESEAHT